MSRRVAASGTARFVCLAPLMLLNLSSGYAIRREFASISDSEFVCTPPGPERQVFKGAIPLRYLVGNFELAVVLTGRGAGGPTVRGNLLLYRAPAGRSSNGRFPATGGAP